MRTSYDALIIGGGPAGLATAIWAAGRGLAAAVFDRRPLPLDKACGEGIMPPGVRLLKEMGVQVPMNARAPFDGIRYIDGDRVAEGRFPAGPGWGVRRTTLIRAMVERARELGVSLHYGQPVEGWRVLDPHAVEVRARGGVFKGRLLVGADGLHSAVRKEAGLGRTSRAGKPRFGVRRHFRVQGVTPWVEVHWARGAEAYVTPVAADEIGVAVLWSEGSEGFESLRSRFPPLAARIGDAPVLGPTRGAGPFRQRVKRRHRGPVALVGDAAGYVDALTGEGLSLAFATTRALVETVARGGDLKDYETAYRRLSRTNYWMTALLLLVTARPNVRRKLVFTLSQTEDLFGRLLGFLVGELPARAVGVRGVAELVRGLALSPSRSSGTLGRR